MTIYSSITFPVLAASAYVVAALAPVAIAGGDDHLRHGPRPSYVDQVDANSANIHQYGTENSVNVDQRVVAVPGASGYGHYGHAKAGTSNSAIAVQAGEMNAINAEQEGANNTLAAGQFGHDNAISSDQRGANNTAVVGQAGTSLKANIDQSGSGLSVGIVQIGAGDGRAVNVRQR